MKAPDWKTTALPKLNWGFSCFFLRDEVETSIRYYEAMLAKWKEKRRAS